MLRDTFPSLLERQLAPEDPHVWESSRFALDLPPPAPKRASGIAVGTYMFFAGMIEFGLSRRLSRIVTVTDLRMERILRRADWPMQRLGKPRTIGNTRAVAEYLDVSAASLHAVRCNGGLSGPVSLVRCCTRLVMLDGQLNAWEASRQFGKAQRHLAGLVG
ncbi:hypothetical protein EOD23_20295 [Mesorhizobium sp. USDA-HM6]|nr:hypothetical protein EOD23_20295 [Mesorhizobium sp. USDA-HM6]